MILEVPPYIVIPPMNGGAIEACTNLFALEVSVSEDDILLYNCVRFCRYSQLSAVERW